MMKLAHNSALQHRPKRIDVRGMNAAAHVLALAVTNRLVIVVFIQEAIAGMFIGSDQGNIVGNGRANETIKSAGVGILDNLGNDHALASDRADYSHFASGAASAVAALGKMLVALFAADVGFIYFDFAAKS